MAWIKEAGTHSGHCQSIKSSSVLELVRTTCIHVQGYPSGDLLIPLRISEPLLFSPTLLHSTEHVSFPFCGILHFINYIIIIAFIFSLCSWHVCIAVITICINHYSFLRSTERDLSKTTTFAAADDNLSVCLVL